MNQFRQLKDDCKHLILQYHEFRLNVYNETEPELLGDDSDPESLPLNLIGREDPNWKFFVRFGSSFCLSGDMIGEFLEKCRDMDNKPSFYSLRITTDQRESSFGYRATSWQVGQPVTGFRGVQKLEIEDFDFCSLPSDVCENFRGVHSLTIKRCKFPPHNRMLENLRGIKELHISLSNHISLSAEDFQNLRGVQKLTICHVPGLVLTSQHLEQLRGIKHFDIPTNAIETLDRSMLEDDSFKNLRGVRYLHISGAMYGRITDAASIHLRGVKELIMDDLPLVTSLMFHNLRGVKKLTMSSLPQVTSSVFQQLGGVLSLTIDDCDEIRFESEYLHHLSGSIKKLDWSRNPGAPGMELDHDHLQHLHTVEELDLSGVTHIAGANAFGHLYQVQVMSLSCEKMVQEIDGIEYVDLVKLETGSLGFLVNARKLEFTNCELHERSGFVSNLTQVPELEEVTVRYCKFSKESAIGSLFDAVFSRVESVSFTLVKYPNGTWQYDE